MIELLAVVGIATAAGGGIALAMRRGFNQRRDAVIAQVARFREMAAGTTEVADELQTRADALGRVLDGRSAAELAHGRTSFDAARQRVAQSVDFSRQLDVATLAKAPKEELGAADRSSAAGVENVRVLGKVRKEFEQLVDGFELRRQKFLADAQTLADRRLMLAAAMSGAQAGGWRVDAIADNVTQIDEWLGAADPTAARVDLAHATEAMALADPALNRATEWAETLPERAEAIRAELSELGAEATHHLSRRPEYEHIARRWEVEHGAGDIDDLSEHVASAMSLFGQIEPVAVQLDAETGPLAKEIQDWAQADVLIQEVRDTVGRARALLEQVDDREAELLVLRDELTEVVAAARSDLDALDEFLQVERGNVNESFQVTLDLGSSLVGQAEAELAKARPEYRQASAMATDAATHLDVALEKAEESKREIQARRATVKRSIMNAHSAVQRLESYHRRSLFASINRYNGEVDHLMRQARALSGDDARTQSRAEALAREADLLRTRIEANRKSEGSIRFE